jgi:multidrug efflux pump
MSHFFIKRPIFAWVLAILIMLGGLLAILKLPIAQYPQIAPTTVITHHRHLSRRQRVRPSENSVTKVIEQGMTGVDNLQYMSSYVDLDRQTSQIADLHQRGQSRHRAGAGAEQAAARSRRNLPQVVQQQGITVVEVVVELPDGLGFVSEDGKLTASDIADYVATRR